MNMDEHEEIAQEDLWAAQNARLDNLRMIEEAKSYNPQPTARGINWGLCFALAFCIAFWVLAVIVVSDVLRTWL